jgi:Arc/MetJ-type ribon-helix-helix transcriptional regulator
VGVKIHLRPELEEMIKQNVQRGPYQTVDEFVEHAISLVHGKEPGWPGMVPRSGQKSSDAT